MITNFNKVEELFSRLIIALKNNFNELEIHEVNDFVIVGEYGLALETLVDIITEENKKVSQEALTLIYKLSDSMFMERKLFDERLKNHIID